MLVALRTQFRCRCGQSIRCAPATVPIDGSCRFVSDRDSPERRDDYQLAAECGGAGYQTGNKQSPASASLSAVNTFINNSARETGRARYTGAYQLRRTLSPQLCPHRPRCPSVPAAVSFCPAARPHLPHTRGRPPVTNADSRRRRKPIVLILTTRKREDSNPHIVLRCVQRAASLRRARTHTRESAGWAKIYIYITGP